MYLPERYRAEGDPQLLAISPGAELIMTNVSQAARDFRRAQETYHEEFKNYFRSQVEPLDVDRFWQLQPVFVQLVCDYRFGYDRTNGVEQAAEEFFRKPYAGDFKSYGGPDVPVYSLDEAVRFARTWEQITEQLHQPLFDVDTDRSDDGYGDLLDTLPLTGRAVVDHALKTGDAPGSGFTNNAEIERAVSRACVKDGWPRLAGLILQGENHIGMFLAEAAENYFALSTAQEPSEDRHDTK